MVIVDHLVDFDLLVELKLVKLSYHSKMLLRALISALLIQTQILHFRLQGHFLGVDLGKLLVALIKFGLNFIPTLFEVINLFKFLF